MTKEEYAKRAESEDFAPGLDAISEEFGRLYPNPPEHYASLLSKRAVFGGDQFLDGYSLYAHGGSRQWNIPS